MKNTKSKKWMIAGGGGLVLVAVLIVALFQWPANQFTLDVNPSLEITTNRMEQVIDVEALNEDGREFLEGYERPGRNLEVVINDLVDRMILTGHISGGQDNIVMITVDSDELDSAYVEKVNEAIAAFLQNKQLEYRILNQGLTESDEEQVEGTEEVPRGKLTLIQKLMQQDGELTLEELQEISLKDLLNIAEQLNISPNELFARSINNHVNGNNGQQEEAERETPATEDEDTVIGWKQATEIALEEVGGGVVVEFEYDIDDREYEIEIMYDGYEYDLEIHAYTGAVLDFDREGDSEADEYVAAMENVISWEEAIEIAKEEAGGGTVVEFEFELDDMEFEIEIKYDGYEFEIDMDANTGAIIKIERELDDDYRGTNGEGHDDQDDNTGDSGNERTVIGKERAIEIAKERIGGGAVIEFEYDRSDGEYEIEIKYDGYEYEIEMNAYTGTITEFERDREDDARGVIDEGQDVIGRARAIEIAKERVGGGTVVEFEYDRDDGEYEIEIKYDGYEYDIEIDAYTGRILKYEWELDDDQRTPPSQGQTVIGRDEAIAIAKEKVGGGTVVEFEYDRDDGEYEIEIKYDGYEYELEIDAYTGEILEFERDDDYQGSNGSEPTVIGRDRAIAIAKERVGGGTVVEFEYDRDDGEYEIEIKYNGKEYEIEIDAYTGEILDFEIDD